VSEHFFRFYQSQMDFNQTLNSGLFRIAGRLSNMVVFGLRSLLSLLVLIGSWRLLVLHKGGQRRVALSISCLVCIPVMEVFSFSILVAPIEHVYNALCIHPQSMGCYPGTTDESLYAGNVNPCCCEVSSIVPLTFRN
jgi:hypothetical protein